MAESTEVFGVGQRFILHGLWFELCRASQKDLWLKPLEGTGLKVGIQFKLNGVTFNVRKLTKKYVVARPVDRVLYQRLVFGLGQGPR
jgi:hypothetical protein